MIRKRDIDAANLPPGLAARLETEAQADVNLWNHSAFMNRTSHCFIEQRRLARAAGESIDFGVEDLRHLVRNHLGARHCYFCRGPITAESFAIVSRVPPERGGGFGFHNLEVVCAPCGRAKGSLDRIEFRELHDVIRSWSSFVRRYFITRLGNGVSDTDLLFPRPNRTIRPIEEMTIKPPPDNERPADDEPSPPT